MREPTHQPDDFVFGPDSMAWKVNRHWTGLLYGPAAALLQVAHPRVAQGVAEHSDFREDALGRLRRTLSAVNRITFGTHDEAERMKAHLSEMHARVRGETAEGIEGRSSYSAFEPDLMLWVLGTLIEASILGYETVFPPLTEPEKEQFYAEFREFGTYFGLPADFGPAGYRDWQAAYIRKRASMAEHPLCAEVASHVVHPRGQFLDFLLGRAGDFVAIEGLDPETRERLELRSTWHTRFRWRMARWLARTLLPRMPKRLSFYPESYEAHRRLGLL